MIDNKLVVHNTLTRIKEQFIPINDKTVNMYVCGITPYDSVHIGHARCYVVFDTIRRYLEFCGYNVNYVQNFTDIDDKIINRSNELGIKYDELSKKFVDEYFEQMAKLNIKPANKYPLVTDHIGNIIKFILHIIDSGFAYIKSGDVYFSVRKFGGYGKLSHRDIDKLRVGARVDPGEQKEDPLDFALWKAAKPDEPSWDSPWGKGRPGWHIECSAMSLNELKVDTIDIHGGGLDLVFPHHENELAQSEACTKQKFVKYWIHNGFVTINKEKMSKSLDNFFTVKEVTEKYDPMILRMFLLTQHYRTPLDFADTLLIQTKNAWDGLVDVYDMIWYVFKQSSTTLPQTPVFDDEVVTEFKKVMDNDFNTERALSVVFELKTKTLDDIKKKYVDNLIKNYFTFRLIVEQVLGLKLPETLYQKGLSEEIERLINSRDTARKQKQFEQADKIRDKIKSVGYVVEDTIWGQRVKPVADKL